MKASWMLARRCVVFLVIVALFPNLFPQGRWGQTPNTNWRDREVRNGRREVTYSIDAPPQGAPDYFRRAVETAIRKWNDAQNYEGAIRLVPVTERGDIRIKWWQLPLNNQNPGKVYPRMGADRHMEIFLSARTGPWGRFFEERELQNLALHELGHAEGLEHDARLTNAGTPRSPAMYPRGDLARFRADKWRPSEEDIAFKRQMYAVNHDQVRPRIDGMGTVVTPAGGGFLYTYTVPLESRSPSPLREFGIFGWAEMTPVSLPKGWEGWFSPPVIDETIDGPAPGAMTVFATPGFELLPGEEGEFVFFSSQPPEMGWVYGTDIAGELTLLGGTSNVLTPVPEPPSLVCLLSCLAFCALRRRFA